MYKLIPALVLLMLGACAPKNHTIHLVTTGDVHGAWFAEPYVDGGDVKTSLLSVKYYVDSIRNAAGRQNVLLLDAGDILQGDNASYYYNYVQTEGDHLFADIASYMGYDVAVVGNHDIETGHEIYDKVNAQLAKRGITWLGGNAVRTDNGEPYFPAYRIIRKDGVRIAVLGFTNPNMKAWLSEPVWSGIEFLSLLPLAQEWVDKVISREKPDAVVMAIHAGTGSGNGDSLESQGLDLLNSLHGVDVLVTSHDHRPVVLEKDGTYLVNAGSKAGYAGHAVINVTRKGRRLISKEVELAESVRLDRNRTDAGMAEHFSSQFQEVREFTNQHVGRIAMDLATRDAYRGMSDYVNLVHTVQISVPEARISIAAPLTFNGLIRSGELIYNDMFSIYPYENQLFVLKMSGQEIKDFLEYSYNGWIVTPGSHVLRIQSSPDARTGSARWSFTGRTYNFDSAAGLIYTVDVTKPAGSRVSISSMADGSPFQPDMEYNVAMTSYRASGGGDTIVKGAGIPADQLDSRVVARYPEIRELIYRFIREHDTITPELVGDKSVIGEWKFVPEKLVEPLMEADMALIF